MTQLAKRLAQPLAALALLISAAAGAGGAGAAFSLGWYSDDECDDAVAQDPGAKGPCHYDVVERDCGNGVDDDSDERTDCLDADCNGTPSCPTLCANEAASNAGQPGECTFDPMTTYCRDSYDNDRDLSVDCNDADCGNSPDCTCDVTWNPTTWGCVFGGGADANSTNSSGSGSGGNTPFGNPAGPGGPMTGPNPLLPGAPTEICGEAESKAAAAEREARSVGVAKRDFKDPDLNPDDEDGDGLVNCDDPDCHTCDPAEACYKQDDPSCGEVCDNSTDDDNDGYVDCDDPDCTDTEACTCPSSFCDSGEECRADCLTEAYCYDMADNDEDGETDCRDSDCRYDPDCKISEVCTNGVDDDVDGSTDCADSDCYFDPSCVPSENCKNGQDDDLDGMTDCTDQDCWFEPMCTPEGDCTNGLDDDSDGATDCADIADCAFNPECEDPQKNCDTIRVAIEEIDAAIRELNRWIQWADENGDGAMGAYRSGQDFTPTVAPDGSQSDVVRGGPDAAVLAGQMSEAASQLYAQRQFLVDQARDLDSRLAVCEGNGYGGWGGQDSQDAPPQEEVRRAVPVEF